MINSGYHDQMPHSAASDLCLHCLFGPVCLNALDNCSNILLYTLASVAVQMDARPTGDQEVAATFFCGDLIIEYFLRLFCPFR